MMQCWTVLAKFGNNCKTQYAGIWKTSGQYWHSYGGSLAFLASPYLHASILLTGVVLFLIRGKENFLREWFDMCLAISPSLLGFTLAGLAVFLGVGDERFRDIIRGVSPGDSSGTSPFLCMIASFMHFTFLQLLVLINVLLGSLFSSHYGAYIVFSVWLFLYSLLVVFAAIFAVFKLATWYDCMPKDEIDNDKGQWD